MDDGIKQKMRTACEQFQTWVSLSSLFFFFIVYLSCAETYINQSISHFFTAFTHRAPKEAGPCHLRDCCFLGAAVVAGYRHLCSVWFSSWSVHLDIISLSLVTDHSLNRLPVTDIYRLKMSACNNEQLSRTVWLVVMTLVLCKGRQMFAKASNSSCRIL